MSVAGLREAVVTARNRQRLARRDRRRNEDQFLGERRAGLGQAVRVHGVVGASRIDQLHADAPPLREHAQRLVAVAVRAVQAAQRVGAQRDGLLVCAFLHIPADESVIHASGIQRIRRELLVRAAQADGRDPRHLAHGVVCGGVRGIQHAIALVHVVELHSVAFGLPDGMQRDSARPVLIERPARHAVIGTQSRTAHARGSCVESRIRVCRSVSAQHPTQERVSRIRSGIRIRGNRLHIVRIDLAPQFLPIAELVCANFEFVGRHGVSCAVPTRLVQVVDDRITCLHDLAVQVHDGRAIAALVCRREIVIRPNAGIILHVARIGVKYVPNRHIGVQGERDGGGCVRHQPLVGVPALEFEVLWVDQRVVEILQRLRVDSQTRLLCAIRTAEVQVAILVEQLHGNRVHQARQNVPMRLERQVVRGPEFIRCSLARGIASLGQAFARIGNVPVSEGVIGLLVRIGGNCRPLAVLHRYRSGVAAARRTITVERYLECLVLPDGKQVQPAFEVRGVKRAALLIRRAGALARIGRRGAPVLQFHRFGGNDHVVVGPLIRNGAEAASCRRGIGGAIRNLDASRVVGRVGSARQLRVIGVIHHLDGAARPHRVHRGRCSREGVVVIHIVIGRRGAISRGPADLLVTFARERVAYIAQVHGFADMLSGSFGPTGGRTRHAFGRALAQR